MPARVFEAKDIAAAQNGADVYYRDNANRVMEDAAHIMPLKDLITKYCGDPHFAERLVGEYLADLPTHDELVTRAFILFKVLITTRSDLADIVGMELDMLEEAESGKQDKAVDNDEIRNSAGYGADVDSNVADSFKSDAAKEQNISDFDVGRSASEDVTYRDQTAFISPQYTFKAQTERLARGIVDHCLASGDIQLLVKAGLEKDPTRIGQQIMRIVTQLEPPRDEGK